MIPYSCFDAFLLHSTLIVHIFQIILYLPHHRKGIPGQEKVILEKFYCRFGKFQFFLLLIYLNGKWRKDL